MNKKYSVDEAITQMCTWKNAVIVVVTAAIFVALGLVFRGHGTTTTTYDGSAKLQIVQYSAKDKVVTLSSNDPAFLNTYVENLRTNHFQKLVKKELAKQSIKVTTSEIDDMTSIDSIPQTMIIRIKVSDGSKKQVNAVRNAYTKVANTQYPKLMKTGTIETIDRDLSENTRTTIMSKKKIIFFMGVLGLFISIFVIFLTKYFNQKIVSANFLNNRGEAAVISSVDLNDNISLQNAASNLATIIRGKYHIVGVSTGSDQNGFIETLVAQLTQWQVNVSVINNECPDIGAQLNDSITLVNGDISNPQSRLILANTQAIIAVVKENETTKDQFFAMEKLAKDASVPFLGSIYLR